jgi:ubiquinone/menaquinone biosynthesis C-methylase UbiE
VAEWDKFWLESSAEASFVGASGAHPVFLEYWSDCFSRYEHISSESRCIDIASGSGTVIQCAQRSFADNLPQYCGLDISAAAIQELTKRLPSVTGIVADAASIPIEPHSFDLVTSQFGVEYAGLDGIHEAARLVSPGGDLALVLHCRPGAIFGECSDSIKAIDRLRQVRFFPLAREMFKAGFAAIHGAARRPHERATRKFRPAFRSLEQMLLKYGEGAASGFLLRLRNDITKIDQRLDHYNTKDVLHWIARLDEEMTSYRLRMKSMTSSAIKRKTLEQIGEQLTELGFSPIETVPLGTAAGDTQLAWSLRAHRDSACHQ